MRLLGVRLDALGAVRRRPVAAGVTPAQALASSAPVDSAAFLGLGPADITGPVQAALTTLLGEIEELRGEVQRLKARLTEAEGLADQDVLTPVLNRRAFVRELRRVIAFTHRYGGQTSLIYFDLDGFKAVNDRFGHAAGDVALKAVAERLAGAVRESDIVGRLGGDEFGVILVHADRATALAKAAVLATLVEDEPIASGEWLMPVRISYGVAQLMPGADAEQALTEADAAMYAHKRAAAG
ncbi:MAG TPA: GGDEF domain-containing protein [Caulobacteraceae bacterium]|nr:GGDEF domain-containing protein [Caulobacteraceae bacterium]